MSTKDTHDMSDEEFEALLQGQGELADLLRAMPQPAPSAELDAAILAQAEAALKSPAANVPKAANDPSMPSAKPAKRPSFVMRWKVPLALAATVILGVHMIGWDALLFPTHKGEAILTDAAPPTAATAPAPPPAPAAETKADRPEQKAKETRAPAAAPAPQPAPKALTENMNQAKPAAPQAALQPKKEAPAAPALAQAEAPAVAAAPPPAPMSAPPAGQAAAAGQISRVEPEPLSKLKSADANTGLSSAAPSESRKAAAPAPAMRAKALQDMQEASPPEAPQSWLTRIEKLLKEDKKKEALEEWNKFRKAYPEYSVRKELADQIDALKKQ